MSHRSRNGFPSFEEFRNQQHKAMTKEQMSPLQADWYLDRGCRQLLPLHAAIRRSVGLAMIFDRDQVSTPLLHAGHRLFPNDKITWACLRDVPPGHFPRAQNLDRRDVAMATLTKAQLRYGMPCIDMGHPVAQFDFRAMPQPATSDSDVLDAEKYTREFQVFNRVSLAMTKMLLKYQSQHRKLNLPQQLRDHLNNCYQKEVEEPEDLFPTAYLSFPTAKLDQLYALATWANPSQNFVISCPKCGGYTEIHRFGNNSAKLELEVFENGDWDAKCPICFRHSVWRNADAVPAKMHRQFPYGFKHRFCAAVAKGLPLIVPGPCQYLGTVPTKKPVVLEEKKHNADLRELDLLAHRFRSAVTGQERLVFVPRSAEISIPAGTHMNAGQQWCQTLPIPDKAWRDMPAVSGDEWDERNHRRRHRRPDRWSNLAGVCGGPMYIGAMQQLWFYSQAIQHPSLPDQTLIPADLVSLAVYDMEPLGLYWDVSPVEEINGDAAAEIGAVVFPPIQARRLDKLQFRLPGEVLFDARISDRRFNLPGLHRVDPDARGNQREMWWPEESLPDDLGNCPSLTEEINEFFDNNELGEPIPEPVPPEKASVTPMTSQPVEEPVSLDDMAFHMQAAAAFASFV